MSESRISFVLLGIVLLFAGVIFYARHVTITRQNNANAVPVVARYTNYAYKVNLRYPPEWRPVGGYSYDRYEGEDGFFGISAGGATSTKATIDQLVKLETTHVQRPYGTEPYVQNLTIDGQEARLIMPSPDQDASLMGQAALVITYPEPVTVGSETYKYFIFWADRAHIQDIASSITFIRS